VVRDTQGQPCQGNDKIGADLRICPKVTSRDENAGNIARFCVKVVTTDPPGGMTLLG